MPVPLDEYPVHQVPLSMRHVATSDRNAYDRCYFNAHDRTGEVFLVTGMGVYPNLGVIDAYATVRRGDEQYTVRISDALGDDRMDQRVGPYRIEVIEPLERVRVVCDGAEHGVAFDLTWTGSFPPVEEPAHVMRQSGRIILDASRFAQVGTWAGALEVGGEKLLVSDDRWVGTRDRSWGIRPVGEPEPPGRAASEPDEGFGFWWLYVPLRFDDFAVVVIAQEDGDGNRLLNEAVRVFPKSSGRGVEQLGWPEVEIRYLPGTRHPESAVLHLRRPRGEAAHARNRHARVRRPQLRTRLRRRPRLDPRAVAWAGLHRRGGLRHARPRRHRSDPFRGGRPHRPSELRRGGGLGHVRARHLRSSRALGIHGVGIGRTPGVAVTDPEPTGATVPDVGGAEVAARPRTSTRDRDELHRRLVRWLATQVRDPEVSALVVPESNGMSSETLLFECTWLDPDGVSTGARVTQACAARLVPDPEAVPVFPVYDLERQFRVLRLVGERTRVPVPRTLWLELDPEPIGTPFFVMERVDGVVPPDIMPYPFGSWLSEAPRVDQDRLQDSSVRVLAELHGADVSAQDVAFLELDRPGDTALRRHLAEQRCLLRMGRGRRGALAAHRADLRLARGPLARVRRGAGDQLG